MEWIPADALDNCDWFPCKVIEVNESEDDSPPLLVAVFAFKTVNNGKYKQYISGITLIGVF